MHECVYGHIIDIDTYDNKTYCFLQGLVVLMKKKSSAAAVLTPTISVSLYGVAPAIMSQQSKPCLKRKRKIIRSTGRLLSFKAATPLERPELLAEIACTPQCIFLHAELGTLHNSQLRSYKQTYRAVLNRLII